MMDLFSISITCVTFTCTQTDGGIDKAPDRNETGAEPAKDLVGVNADAYAPEYK